MNTGEREYANRSYGRVYFVYETVRSRGELTDWLPTNGGGYRGLITRISGTNATHPIRAGRAALIGTSRILVSSVELLPPYRTRLVRMRLEHRRSLRSRWISVTWISGLYMQALPKIVVDLDRCSDTQ